jgi:hypothetical protein
VVAKTLLRIYPTKLATSKVEGVIPVVKNAAYYPGGVIDEHPGSLTTKLPWMHG